MKAVIATNNPKKLAEMRAILSDLDFELLSMDEAGLKLDIEETGLTFEENARIKALAVMNASGLCAISDDSGLAVKALGGAPGVFSARYGGGACETDLDRCRFLLSELGERPDREAEFVCCVCCVFPGGEMIETRGVCRGEILSAPRGEGGFGYDPLFYLPEQGLSMAQLDEGKKNRISHRGAALAEFREELCVREKRTD